MSKEPEFKWQTRDGPMSTDAEFIAEMKALAEKATPGEWEIDYNPEQSPNIWIGSRPFPSVAKIEISDHDDGQGEVLVVQDFDDAAFIAASRAAIPRLITMVEAEKGRAEQVEAELRVALAAEKAANSRADIIVGWRNAALAEVARLRKALVEVHDMLVRQRPLTAEEVAKDALAPKE